MPHCRICKIEIDKEKNDWIMPSKNWYYHKKCYNDWKQSTPLTDKEYEPFIYDFLSRDLKVKYDFFKVKQQIENFQKQNMTIKGQFFTLKYFYEIKKGDWSKGHGGIGIIPYIYQEACLYWIDQEKKSNGIVAEIEQQMKIATERQKKVVKKKEVKPRKFTVDLNAIADMEEDE